MMSSFKPLSLLLSLSLVFCCTFVNAADSKRNYTGWELESEYNKLYNAKELDKLKGHITKFFTVTPMKGMAPGTAFLLDEGDDEPIIVHLCPEAFISAKKTGLKKGKKTKVRGSWAVIDDQDVFMASKVKQGDHFEVKVRLTSDGTPFWTMSAEELAKESK